MGSEPVGPLTEKPREWLAMPGGRIRPVVSVPSEDGADELLAYEAWLARLRPTCHCGRPRLGSGRTCGSTECVRELARREGL
jgi:hypothetical protein